MVNFTIKQLLENGVHYGHSTRRWNPKMAPFIYGTYNSIHVIDLQKTAPMLANSLEMLKKVVSKGGRVLFVGTKKQASSIVKEYAQQCGQYYVNHRWLGGMLTNWKTITQSIHKLNKLNKQIEDGMEGLTKKEKLNLTRERDKLDLVLGGISKMGGLPDMIFIIDSTKESIAIEEANKLGIPVVAIVDTNANPDNINYVIPGNDDAIKAIRLYCELVSQSIIDGIREEVKTSGDALEAKVAKKAEKQEQAPRAKTENTKIEQADSENKETTEVVASK